MRCIIVQLTLAVITVIIVIISRATCLHSMVQVTLFNLETCHILFLPNTEFGNIIIIIPTLIIMWDLLLVSRV